MMTLENEIFNLNGAMNLLATYDGEDATPLFEALNISDDFDDTTDFYSLLDDMAILDTGDGDAAVELYEDGAIQVNRIDRNSDLLNGLIQWYGTLDNVVNHVRSAELVNGSLYFLTGIGYDTFTADVLNMKDNEHARQIFNEVITGAPLSESEKAAIETARK